MKLVIIEDNALVLKQLLRLVGTRAAIRVAGTAADEKAAVSLVHREHPDAILLDLSLASGSGINVLRRIRAAGVPARVLVLTNHTAEIARRACESFGIDGFYDKSGQSRDCVEQLFSWLPQSTGDTK